MAASPAGAFVVVSWGPVVASDLSGRVVVHSLDHVAASSFGRALTGAFLWGHASSLVLASLVLASLERLGPGGVGRLRHLLHGGGRRPRRPGGAGDRPPGEAAEVAQGKILSPISRGMCGPVGEPESGAREPYRLGLRPGVLQRRPATHEKNARG